MNVTIDDPNADTEWNDILRKHGIIPEKPPSPTPMIEEALTEARRLAHENRLEGKELDELDELEDEEDEDFLNSYRQKRLAEISSLQQASVYNQVYPLQKPDYSRDVTEESNKAFVLVLLTSSSGTNTESRIAMEIWTTLAQIYGDIKFCQIRADLCIDGYPDKNTPTILMYKDANIKRQIVTLRELNGVRTSRKDFERVLIDAGAVKHGDSRLIKSNEEEEEEPQRIIKNSKPSVSVEEDDSDWE